MTFPDQQTKTDWLRDLHEHFSESWKEQAGTAHPNNGRIVGLERSIALALEELVEIHTTK